MLGREPGRGPHALRGVRQRSRCRPASRAEQLRDPDIAASEKILRRCVHCGFCTATCPTYLLLGDELDSPRGRIYLIKDMLENDSPASERVVKHIDRCLSCLACMTTCPSDVHYMHLVDHARRHIEATYRRPLPDRLLRAMLATVLPRPLAVPPRAARRLARQAVRALSARAPARDGRAGAGASAGALAGRPAAGVFRRRAAARAGRAAQRLRPAGAGARDQRDHDPPADPPRRRGRGGRGAGCCGALTHHLGKERPALRAAKANIDAWTRELEGAGLDAVVINASGCGTTVKDYGFMLREDAAYAGKAARISAIAKDVTELMSALGLAPPGARDRARGGLPLGLLDAARPEHPRGAQAAAERRRLPA